LEKGAGSTQERRDFSDPAAGDRRVSVIVPAYKAIRYLPACLGSLERQKGVEVGIIVSDNASGDGSVEYIREHHPAVRLIENGANLGFSAAVNRALAQTGGAPYIALVNPDTETRQGCLSRLVDALERTPAAGIAVPRLMAADNPKRIDCLGTAVTSAFGQLSIGGGRENILGFHKERFVPAGCGGGMMIRAKVFDSVGPFDEDYFLCWEDMEFSLRAFRSGFKCLLVPKAKILHATTSIMGRWSRVNVFNYCRGALPTAVKLLPMRDLLLLLPLILFNRLKVDALYAGGGRLGSAIQGELSSIPLAWRMFKKRRSLPPAAKGYRMRDLLREGDRLRKVMKYNELFPSEQDHPGEESTP
jgi:GT2 family glycosyltransferase